MKIYQLISLIYIYIIYLLALIPSFLLTLKKSIYTDKSFFIKHVSLSIIIEIFIFSLIYFFSDKLLLFIPKINIRNYSDYAFKILFISSSITGLHILVPLYFYFNKSKKLALHMFSLKFMYIPVLMLGYILFNTKGIFFAFPVCDIVYSLFLIYLFLKNK